MGKMRLGLAAVLVATLAAGHAPSLSAVVDSTCGARSGTDIRWLRVSPPREHAAIDRWCAGVGPPARISAEQPPEEITRSLVVVSWNTHVGAGDIDAFVGDLRSGRMTGAPVTAFVLLLQEVYRAGAEVPTSRSASWAAAERESGPRGVRVDAVGAARRLGLWSVYVPSMRNGAPDETSEDRGNAVLSTLPLTDVTAIELPLERQRRVAISAAVSLKTDVGTATTVRFVCTHFTNMVLHHLWLLSESGRLRQARALSNVLPRDGALVVGGDFNAWFGYKDAAYRQLAEVAHHAQTEDRRPTFGPMRLDHILFRLPDDWKTTLRRANDKYGSDHFPLMATIDLQSARRE
jgi:endonuclease/exonuclease/phosphatase family metal-dependent hydrolase